MKRCSVHFSPRRTRQPPCHMCGNGAPPCGAAERNSIAMPRRGATRSASAGASRAPHIWLAARTASSSKFRVVLATFVRESVRGVVACTPPAQLQKALYHTVRASIQYGCSFYHIWLQAPEGLRKRSSRRKAATKELHSRRTSDEDEPPPPPPPPLSLALASMIAACLAHGNSVAPPCMVCAWYAYGRRIDSTRIAHAHGAFKGHTESGATY